MTEEPIQRAEHEVGRSSSPADAITQSADAVHFGFLLGDVSRLWRVALDRTLKPLGVTRSQYSVMASLSRRDGMTQTALAAGLELTKVAVGGLLERMETAGFVERRQDSADARIRRVYLTRKGIRITHRIRALADPLEADLLAPLGDSDIAVTIRALSTIKSRLAEIDQTQSVTPERLPLAARRGKNAKS
jgi:DNA-binding MarR family transcriptional regulator